MGQVVEFSLQSTLGSSKPFCRKDGFLATAGEEAICRSRRRLWFCEVGSGPKPLLGAGQLGRRQLEALSGAAHEPACLGRRRLLSLIAPAAKRRWEGRAMLARRARGRRLVEGQSFRFEAIKHEVRSFFLCCVRWVSRFFEGWPMA